MSEFLVPSKTIRVGPHLVDVVSNLSRLDALYLDVSGSSYQVLGTLGPTHLCISTFTTTPTGDLHGAVELLADHFEDDKKFAVYRVVSTTTGTGELTALKVGRKIHLPP